MPIKISYNSKSGKNCKASRKFFKNLSTPELLGENAVTAKQKDHYEIELVLGLPSKPVNLKLRIIHWLAAKIFTLSGESSNLHNMETRREILKELRN